jgi:hypothetical protein
VTPPPYYGQQPPPPGNDKVTLWGILGIIFSICCWPLGIVFGVLGLMEARKVGKPPTLAYIAFGIIALRVIFDIIALTTGVYSNWINA